MRYRYISSAVSSKPQAFCTGVPPPRYRWPPAIAEAPPPPLARSSTSTSALPRGGLDRGAGAGRAKPDDHDIGLVVPAGDVAARHEGGGPELAAHARSHAHGDRALPAMAGDRVVGDFVVDEAVGRCTVRAHVSASSPRAPKACAMEITPRLMSGDDLATPSTCACGVEISTTSSSPSESASRSSGCMCA